MCESSRGIPIADSGRSAFGELECECGTRNEWSLYCSRTEEGVLIVALWCDRCQEMYKLSKPLLLLVSGREQP
jgi:hypothetical protein